MEQSVVAFDPGETTGFARLRIDAILQEWGQLDFDDMTDYCNNFDPDGIEAIVVEKFQLFRKKAKQQIGSEFVTSQVIGLLRGVARKHKIPIVMQGPDIKIIAEKYSGVKPTGPHSQSHKIDAYNHGYYYLVRQYHALTKMEKEQATKNPSSSE
jgi:hypothetical protein